ncbi:MAG TPA: hypothetical protein PKG83_01315 [bacterium]|nr:hypothetical protein [bacterium]
MNILKQRWAKYYRRQNKNHSWHLLIDSILVIIVLILIGINLYFSAFRSALVLGTIELLPTPSDSVITDPSDTAEPTLAPIDFSLTVTSNQLIVTPGTTINYTVYYQNNSPIDLTDVSINFNTNPALANNPRATAVIKQIPAGANGNLDFSIISQSPSVGQSANNLILESSVQASFKHPQQPELEITINSDKLVQKVTTSITLNAFARYYSDQGDQIGIGPLPPQVGQTTKYWVFISLSDYFNDLENITIKAELGPNVALTGKQSASASSGLINAGRQITWQIDQARILGSEPANVGVAAEVALTPQKEQIGANAILLQNISLSATDASTKTLIMKTSPNITTVLFPNQEKNNNSIVIK